VSKGCDGSGGDCSSEVLRGQGSGKIQGGQGTSVLLLSLNVALDEGSETSGWWNDEAS